MKIGCFLLFFVLFCAFWRFGVVSLVLVLDCFVGVWLNLTVS